MSAPKKTTSRAKKAETVIAWKGFDKNLQCAGGGKPFQFEIGGTYTHEGSVEACRSGFHACRNPLDVWSYYDLGGENRFCRVQASGKISEHEGDSKLAAETLYVETEVTLGEMIRAGVKYEIDAALAKADNTGAMNASSGSYARNASSGYGATNASSGSYARNASSGYYATNASSGYGARNASSGSYARNASSGYGATNASSGYGARNASSGNCARNASSGNYARNASSGNYARNASSGYGARNASSGNYATNASSGNYARNASSGNYATNAATGANSVLAAAGLGSRLKGATGTAFALTYEDDKGQIRFAHGVVGEDGIEADTWYRCEGGKVVKA